MRKSVIIHNRIRCNVCGDILESTSKNQFVVCSCWKESEGRDGCFCDGAHDYLRRGGYNWEDLSEVVTTDVRGN